MVRTNEEDLERLIRVFYDEETSTLKKYAVTKNSKNIS